MRTKTVDLFKNIICNDFDVIVLTETWLNSGVTDNELFDSRYIVYRRDRESSGFHTKKEGGGVLVAVSKRLKSFRLFSYESDCEDLWVKVEVQDTKGKINYLYICGVYMPPPVQKHILEHFFTNASSILENHNGHTLILGDFNLSGLTWNKKCNNSALSVQTSNSVLNNMLVDFMSLNNLTQFNANVNNKNKILDLVLSTLTITNVSTHPDPISVIDPLHPPLQFDVELQSPEWLSVKPDTKFHFYKADYEAIMRELNNISWTEKLLECTTVDEMVTVFYKIIRSSIEKHVPKFRTRINNGKYPIWFSGALIKLLKEKLKYRKKYRQYKNPRDLLTFELLRERSNKLQQSNYIRYLELLESSLCSNPKLLWSFIKRKRGGNSTYPAQMASDSNVATNGSEICDLFATQYASVYNQGTIKTLNDPSESVSSIYLTSITFSKDQILKVLKRLNVNKGAGADGIPAVFVVRCANALATPLTIIINKSLSSGIFPMAWKEALVVPLFKSGDTTLVKNYRPISIITVFAKVFETLLCPILSWQFKQFILPEQHGFVKARSTATNLLSFVEDLTVEVDRGKTVDVIYTDFTKAFDTVNHFLLLQKLSSLGIAGDILKWCRSYLSNRKSVVVVGGHKSKPFIAQSGVPQGSHLGPLLFTFFINDISKCFSNSKFYMFADDLKFFRVVNSQQDQLLLQTDLNKLVSWCTLNDMNLNIDKCKIVRFTRKKELTAVSYSVDDVPLGEVDHIRDLGIIIDNKLRFNIHIDQIAKQGFKTLGFVMRNCKEFKKPSTTLAIYNSLVRSSLEYCSVVWNPHYDIYIKRLESVQKRFLWQLSFKCNLAKILPSYEDRLRHFHLKTLYSRRKLLDNMFLYKLINGHIDAPNLLCKTNINVPSRLPRLNKYSPFVQKIARTNLGQFSPLNRIFKTYNVAHNLKAFDDTRDCDERDIRKSKKVMEIDIFSNPPHKFKNNIGQTL